MRHRILQGILVSSSISTDTPPHTQSPFPAVFQRHGYKTAPTATKATIANDSRWPVDHSLSSPRSQPKAKLQYGQIPQQSQGGTSCLRTISSASQPHDLSTLPILNIQGQACDYIPNCLLVKCLAATATLASQSFPRKGTLTRSACKNIPC